MPQTIKTFLTTAQAARKFGISVQSIRRDIYTRGQDGRPGIPGAIKVGRDWLIPADWRRPHDWTIPGRRSEGD